MVVAYESTVRVVERRASSVFCYYNIVVNVIIVFVAVVLITPTSHI